MTKGIKNVKIFANTENRGISVRINQGIAAAEGKYTRMLDSDDIFPLDSTQKMVQLAEELSADMVYGTFTKTGKEPTELEHEFMNDNFTYDFDKDALRTVLTGRFTRMGQLIRTEVLQKAGGADERVFIQDESIPLRAALHARGIVKIHDNVVLVPKELGNFSATKCSSTMTALWLTVICFWTIRSYRPIFEKCFMHAPCPLIGSLSKKLRGCRI